MAESDKTFTINGQTGVKGRLSVPESGPWVLDANMADDSKPLSGKVTIQLLGSELTGTVAPTQAGTFGAQFRVRIVGGAGGWSSAAAKKGYHNDAGVKASQVAREVAASVGETIGGFSPAADRVGIDYAVRGDVPASTALEDVAGAGRWWVDYEGITQVGDRPKLTPKPGSYEVLQADLRNRSALVAIDTLDAVGVGSVLTERLNAPARVAGFELLIDGGSARMLCWLTDDGQISEGADLLVSIVERIMARKLLGKYRYRVVKMVSDRVQLQAVDRRGPMPDMPVVSMWGAPGVHATLNGGDLVQVEFEGGDPSVPMITGFAPRGESGDAPDKIELGGKNGKAVARQGDVVKTLFPPFLFTGVVGGVPASGVLTAVTGQTLGNIDVGSSKVKAVD